MNRRDFFRASAAALLGFTILPGAGRIWKSSGQVCRDIPNYFDAREYFGKWDINPKYLSAPYEMIYSHVSEAKRVWSLEVRRRDPSKESSLSAPYGHIKVAFPSRFINVDGVLHEVAPFSEVPNLFDTETYVSIPTSLSDKIQRSGSI